MKRRHHLFPNPLACAYCTQMVSRPEAEHVFPESWYPDGTPRAEMAFVPSCRGCNHFYGKVEERLGRVLLMCVDPRITPQIGSVHRRVERSIRPRDIFDKHRAGKRRSLQASIQILGREDVADALPSPVHPQFGPMRTPGGLSADGAPALRYNPNDLDIVTQKLVRGVYWLCQGQPLPLPVSVDTPVMTDNPGRVVRSVLDQGLELRGFPPAFVYTGGVSASDPLVSIWFFVIWDHFVLSGITGVTREAHMRMDEGPLPVSADCG